MREREREKEREFTSSPLMYKKLSYNIMVILYNVFMIVMFISKFLVNL
jgi:hypothetical protein